MTSNERTVFFSEPKYDNEFFMSSWSILETTLIKLIKNGYSCIWNILYQSNEYKIRTAMRKTRRHEFIEII